MVSHALALMFGGCHTQSATNAGKTSRQTLLALPNERILGKLIKHVD